MILAHVADRLQKPENQCVEVVRRGHITKDGKAEELLKDYV